MGKSGHKFRRISEVRKNFLGWVIISLFLAGPAFGVPGSADQVFGDQNLLGGPEERVRLEIVPQYLPGAAGAQFGLAVVFHIDPEWHVYANPKRGTFGMDTVITPEPVAGIIFGPIIYPEGEFYEYVELQASNHIYRDGTVCYIPVTVSEGLEGTIAVNLTVEGQMCSDDGQCVPWDDKAALELPIVPDPAAAQLNKPEVFKGYAGGMVQPVEALDTITQSETGVTTAPEKPEELEASRVGEFAADQWLLPILMAIVAGLVMNVMPCVLPIIPIIIMTLMKQCTPAEGMGPDRGKSIKVGLAFAAGIMIVFGGLAIIMTSFNMLWGQHFQSNGFRLVLLMVVFVLGLSMFGLFEIVLPARVSNMSVNRQGYVGALGMGMLATVLATPCGAPLLTPVLAWSVVKPPIVTFTVFLIIGAGMALPYVLLTAFPHLLNRVPAAGNWMIRLKQAIGFAMLGFSAWIIFLFPVGWHKPLLYFCLMLGFCIWLGLSLGHPAASLRKRYLVRGIALILIIASSVVFAMTPKINTTSTGEKWHVQLASYQEQNRSVIVKFTANWCKNCAVLDKRIYKSELFKDKLAATNTALVIADWSYDDPAITQMLIELGGPGQTIPFTAIFPGGDSGPPITLEALYSLQDTLDALDLAAQRSAGSAERPGNNK